MATTKGFRVDPDKLMDVASMVRQLHDDVTGVTGVRGTLPSLQNQGGPQTLAQGLAPFWGSAPTADPFAQAFKKEHHDIVTTYQTMATQLQNLMQACLKTAQAYQKHDQQSTQDVNRSGGDLPGNGSTSTTPREI